MSTLPERYRAVRQDGTPIDLDDIGGVTPTQLADALAPKADQAAVDAALSSVASSSDVLRLRNVERSVTDPRYGAPVDGIADATAGLAAAAADGAIVLPAGVYRVASNLTIATAVRFMPGAVLKPSSGVTVTLAGRVTAPAAQVFDLSAGGAVVIGQGTDGVAQVAWWGALPGVASDQTTAVQAALSSPATGNAPMVMEFGLGVWRLNSGLVIDPNRVFMRGKGAYQTFLDFSNRTTAGAAIEIAKVNGDNRKHAAAVDMSIDGPTTTGTTVDGIALGPATGTATLANQCAFNRVRLNGFRYQVVARTNSWCDSFIECYFRAPVVACIYGPSGFANYGENYSFFACTFSGNGPAASTAVLVQTGGWSFYACSFDYIARAFDITGDARVETIGAWWETNDAAAQSATEFIRLTTSDAYSCSLAIRGGTLHPAYTSTGTYGAFARITGTTHGSNHTALDIDGLYVDSGSAANANTLVHDESTTPGTTSRHNGGDCTFRALRYRDSSVAPWTYRARNSVRFVLDAGLDLGNPVLEQERLSGWGFGGRVFFESIPRVLATDKVTPTTGDMFFVPIPNFAGGLSFTQYELLAATGAQNSGATLDLSYWTLNGSTLGRFNTGSVGVTGVNQFRSRTQTQSGSSRGLGPGSGPVFLSVRVTQGTGTAAELRGKIVDSTNPLLSVAGTGAAMQRVGGKLTGQSGSVPLSLDINTLATTDFIPWMALHPLAF